jgi:hypothetical protein
MRRRARPPQLHRQVYSPRPQSFAGINFSARQSPSLRCQGNSGCYMVPQRYAVRPMRPAHAALYPILRTRLPFLPDCRNT